MTSDACFQILEKEKNLCAQAFAKISSRCVFEASKGLPSSKHYILNSCLKCLFVMLNYKPFLDNMGSYIDGHLAPVYQILESRLVPECDDDILQIAINFAKNSEIPHETLFVAIGDMASYYKDLMLHSNQVLQLIDESLGLLANAFANPQALDEGSAAEAKAHAANVWYLARTMMNEAVKTANELEGVDQIAINNGALACQLCIQGLAPYLATQSLEVEALLQQVGSLAETLKVAPDSFLFSRLYGIFCCGFMYLPEITITYLEKKQAFDGFLGALTSKSNCFVTGYDRKLQILAMIEVFKAKLRSERLDSTAITCLDAAVLGLHVQRMEEDLKLSNQQKSLGRDSKSDKSKGSANEIDKQDIAVYNMVKGKAYNLSKVLQEEADSPEEQEEILEFLMGSDRDAKRSLTNIKSKVMKIDEFKEFIQMFTELKGFFREKIGDAIVDKLSSAARVVLPGILQCQKIATVVNERQHDVDAMPRKIVKVKARQPGQ